MVDRNVNIVNSNIKLVKARLDSLYFKKIRLSSQALILISLRDYGKDCRTAGFAEFK